MMPEIKMTKFEFMVHYVLNRASTVNHTIGLDGSSAAKEAAEAWEVIQKECSR